MLSVLLNIGLVLSWYYFSFWYEVDKGRLIVLAWSGRLIYS